MDGKVHHHPFILLPAPSPSACPPPCPRPQPPSPLLKSTRSTHGLYSELKRVPLISPSWLNSCCRNWIVLLYCCLRIPFHNLFLSANKVLLHDYGWGEIWYHNCIIMRNNNSIICTSNSLSHIHSLPRITLKPINQHNHKSVKLCWSSNILFTHPEKIEAVWNELQRSLLSF